MSAATGISVVFLLQVMSVLSVLQPLSHYSKDSIAVLGLPTTPVRLYKGI